MKPACNIDQRGRRIRGIMGIVLILAAVPMLIFWAPGGGAVAWIVSICVLVSGLFGLYEYRFSWCAMRAMGFKVPW